MIEFVARCQQVVKRLLRSGGCSNVVGAAFNNSVDRGMLFPVVFGKLYPVRLFLVVQTTILFPVDESTSLNNAVRSGHS